MTAIKGLDFESQAHFQCNLENNKRWACNIIIFCRKFNIPEFFFRCLNAYLLGSHHSSLNNNQFNFL